MMMNKMSGSTRKLWRRLDGPLKVGLSFALLGIGLTVIGIFRDPTTPVTLWSLSIGSLIAGLVWGLVSWAIATAAVEVERDVEAASVEEEEEEAPPAAEAEQEATEEQEAGEPT